MSSRPSNSSIPSVITDLLHRELEPSAVEQWHSSIQGLPDEVRTTLIELLQELISHSPRSAVTSLRLWATATQCLPPGSWLAWLDLGTAISSHSATAALKYFKESLPWLERLPKNQTKTILEIGLELTDRNYGVVTAYLAAAPDILDIIPPESLSGWVNPGLTLAEADIVLAVEYFRISPAILNFLVPQDLRPWVELGMSLVVPNRLGKPDYIRAIEYFRLSPVIFSSLYPAEIRPLFMSLAHRLALVSAEKAWAFLQLGAELLQTFSSSEIRKCVLEQGLRLADRDPEVVTDYFKHAPHVLDLVKQSVSDFKRWVDTGFVLYAQNEEKARAYFNRRSRMEQETANRLAGGLHLPQIARVLQLYAEGLSGHPVRIRSSEELPDGIRGTTGSRPATEGRAIYLPERIRYFSEFQDNYRFYKVATLHEIGHLEFGTYDLDFSSVQDLSNRLQKRFKKDPPRLEPGSSDAFFPLYPDSSLARTLWEILEDARIDYLLRHHYPGVRRDMDTIVAFELKSRPALEGLPPKRAIQEALLQLSVTDTTDVSLEMAPVISAAYDLILKIKQPEATAIDSVKLLEPLYGLVEDWLKSHPLTEGETDPLGSQGQKEQEKSNDASPEQGQSQSISLSYRGTMNPDWIKSSRQDEPGGRIPPGVLQPDKDPTETSTENDELVAGSSPPVETVQVESLTSGQSHSSQPAVSEALSERSYYYDEWDAAAQDYRPRWTRLVEKPLASSNNSFVEETSSKYGGTLKLLRRYFKTLKPEALRRLKRQTDGEEMDFDALLEARIEALAGRTPTDRVYIKTEKRERNVAVAFLLDMSGSTSQTIGETGKRVIDVEKEGLVLLSESLQAVGDTYGIFGFSGSGHEQVDFFVLKDFSEKPGGVLSGRIGAVRPLAQNRDGAAIRHAVFKLLQQPARTRLLILISDGKPLDADYTGAYSIEDTKVALREARMKGIYPYCITIDREASHYLSDMYGEVRYTIIDNVLSLPNRLPQIYRRLTA